MKISRKELIEIVKEETARALDEFANPDTENALNRALDEYIDQYMMKMQVNPGDPQDVERVRRQVINKATSRFEAFLGIGESKK
tara:strand:+ start:9702 stop:9953 length:252 start_codon:yes stop_codon:yes gene_type:complete